MVRYTEIMNEGRLDPRSDNEIRNIFHACFNYSGDIEIDENGLISVRRDCKMYKEVALTKLPVRFKHARKDFECSDNQLVTLDGAPDQVGGRFDCSNNKLVSLKNGPTWVGGNFNCWKNELESLEGLPELNASKMLICNQNKLKNLKGAPSSIGTFRCEENPLESIEGMPNIVAMWVKIKHNGLTSIKGIKPSSARGYDFAGNIFTSLEGFENLNARDYIVVTWHPNLPLLRSVNFQAANFGFQSSDRQDPQLDQIQDITNKYAGKGLSISNIERHKLILEFQYELIKSGFKGNAKW